MSMTKKDYVAIARAINEGRAETLIGDEPSTHTKAVDGVAMRIADAMEDQSDKFDRARFLKACGVNN